MKRIRKTRITLKRRRVIVVGKPANVSGEFCPFCNSPLSGNELPAAHSIIDEISGRQLSTTEELNDCDFENKPRLTEAAKTK